MLCDLEADDPRQHVGTAQAIVFAAGAGPGSGPERKRTVDLGGAVKLIEAARELGVARYVMVSSMGTSDVEHADEAMRPYLQAKKDADDALMASGLDWTIVRPGRLTDAPGTGTVDAARALGRRGEITRDDTALVLLETLGGRARSASRSTCSRGRRRSARWRVERSARRPATRASATAWLAGSVVPSFRASAAVTRTRAAPRSRRRGISAAQRRSPWRPHPQETRMFPANSYVIRLAGDADEPALERLAAARLRRARSSTRSSSARSTAAWPPRSTSTRAARSPIRSVRTAHLRAQLHVRAAALRGGGAHARRRRTVARAHRAATQPSRRSGPRRSRPAIMGAAMRFSVEPSPAGGYFVRLAGADAPVSRHDTEEEAEAAAAVLPARRRRRTASATCERLRDGGEVADPRRARGGQAAVRRAAGSASATSRATCASWAPSAR